LITAHIKIPLTQNNPACYERGVLASLHEGMTEVARPEPCPIVARLIMVIVFIPGLALIVKSILSYISLFVKQFLHAETRLPPP